MNNESTESTLYYCGGFDTEPGMITPRILATLRNHAGRIVLTGESNGSRKKAIMVFKGASELATMLRLSGIIVHPYYMNPDLVDHHFVNICTMDDERALRVVSFWRLFGWLPAFIDEHYYDITTIEVRRPNEN